MHSKLKPHTLRKAAAQAHRALKNVGVNSLLADPISNPKIAKNLKYGVMTAPLHLSPGKLSGHQVCPMATQGCLAACLHTAGHPAYMRGKARARNARTKAYFSHRVDFMVALAADIAAVERKATKAGMRCGIRLNATSDIPWENVPVIIGGKIIAANLMTLFPRVMFYDYTKRANRFDKSLPKNYKLTFSLAENNDCDATRVLEFGGNVAAVFATKRNRDLPLAYKFDGKMWPVLDGDLHDYRPADRRGYIVGLRAKGQAIGDRSGFVRSAA